MDNAKIKRRYRRVRIGRRFYEIDTDRARQAGRRIGKALFYIALAGIGVALFRWGHDYATQERGYNAIGGEMFFLLLPLFWWMFSQCLKDTIRTIFEVWDIKPPTEAAKKKAEAEERRKEGAREAWQSKRYMHKSE